MRTWWTMRQDQEKSLGFDWYNPLTGLVVNYSSGFSFRFQLISVDHIYFDKTSQIVGAATLPNVTVAIIAGELSTTPGGLYIVNLVAHNTAQNTDDIFAEEDPPILEVVPTPTV